MRRWVRSVVDDVLGRLDYQLVNTRTLPLGDVAAFCRNVSQRGFRPERIFDVGANKGVWSRTASNVFPDAEYTLIEPQIEMKPYLDRFCAEIKHASWINAGAGDVEGELKITLFPDTVSSGFAFTDEQARELGLDQRTVPIVTLDGVGKDVGGIPEMVKLDVEGFEDKVLAGACSLIGVTEVFLLELTFFEPHGDAKSFAGTIAMMAELGYYPYDFTTFQRRPFDGALGLCEIAFVRDGGVLRSYLGWS